MTELFSLEVEASDNPGILVGDEVFVNPNLMPRGNGKDFVVFDINGEKFISRFIRFGSYLLLIGGDEKIKVVKATEVEFVGKVVGGSFEIDLELVI